MKETKKFKDWCNYFLDPQSETKGNATKSALRAYKTKKYHSAGQIGHENLKKLENLGLFFSEQNGITALEWHKILASKAIKGTYEQTIDYMQRIGLLEKDNNTHQKQINQQFNFANLAEEFALSRKARGLDTPKSKSILMDFQN
jgi:hypothetical protein